MRCSKCDSDNPAGNNFCARCGNALARPCLKCGSENPPASNFCGQCGAALSAPVRDPIVATPPPQAPEIAGERRHLTVLFCDLVGSTAIAAQLDPEQWRETVAGYHRAAAAAITRFDGHVAKYLGDGVMAYFGWPAAHDNDAERAARAGLAILDAHHEAQPAAGPRPVVGAGRHRFGSGGDRPGRGPRRRRSSATCPTSPLACRRPPTRTPSRSPTRCSGWSSGLFVVEDRGAQKSRESNGRSSSIAWFGRAGCVDASTATAAMRGMTPFVGREDELRSLLHRWERVLEGEGQVVTIIGEAGIGKSRLVQRLRDEMAATPHTWLECATAPFSRTPPSMRSPTCCSRAFAGMPAIPSSNAGRPRSVARIGRARPR